MRPVRELSARLSPPSAPTFPHGASQRLRAKPEGPTALVRSRAFGCQLLGEVCAVGCARCRAGRVGAHDRRRYPGGATVFTHSAQSGEFRGGRLTLRGVSRRVTAVTNAGHSGVVSMTRLHARLFGSGIAPATGTLHVAGDRGGDESTCGLDPAALQRLAPYGELRGQGAEPALPTPARGPCGAKWPGPAVRGGVAVDCGPAPGDARRQRWPGLLDHADKQHVTLAWGGGRELAYRHVESRHPLPGPARATRLRRYHLRVRRRLASRLLGRFALGIRSQSRRR